LEIEVKKALILISLFAIFLIGCQDTTMNPVSTENPVSLSSAKISVGQVPDNTPVALDQVDFGSNELAKWGNLHNRFGNASGHSIFIKNHINGSLGGILKFNNYSTWTNFGKAATISADLSISQNAISGDQDIYMVVDPDNKSVTFYPDIPHFNGNVTLDVTINGIDLSDLPADTSQIDFVYVPDDPNMNIQIISTDGITLDENTGSIGVNSAHLKHFSRYVWATKTSDNNDNQ
jgi:hypothetical protein